MAQVSSCEILVLILCKAFAGSLVIPRVPHYILRAAAVAGHDKGEKGSRPITPLVPANIVAVAPPVPISLLLHLCPNRGCNMWLRRQIAIGLPGLRRIDHRHGAQYKEMPSQPFFCNATDLIDPGKQGLIEPTPLLQ